MQSSVLGTTLLYRADTCDSRAGLREYVSLYSVYLVCVCIDRVRGLGQGTRVYLQGVMDVGTQGLGRGRHRDR